MLKILINSYACCPNMGSEPGMGWNWIVSLAQYCELYVISEGEFKEQCQQWCSEHPAIGHYIHWYWNPVHQSTRDKCWNQGNWSFYPLYKKWQKRTADIAREICHKEKVDILHQLNMIGFREPGYLWQVSRETDIPFVWGPIGGLKMFPPAYSDGGGIKMKVFNWLKDTITKWQIKHDKRVIAALKTSSLLISSIPDSYNTIKKYHGLESVIIPETGCFVETFQNDIKRFRNDNLRVIWVGKFDFRKRLDIAIRAIAMAGNPKICLEVYGTGTSQQIAQAQTLISQLKVESSVKLMGSVSNMEIKKIMKTADVFLFTSVSEDTSTVVLEAVSNHLPVICFNACGMSTVITEDIGFKINLTNPKQSAKDFSVKLNYLFNHRDVLETMSESSQQIALELSWDNKAKQMQELFEHTVSGNHKK